MSNTVKIDLPCHIEPSPKRNILLILVFLILWIIPMAALDSLISQSGLFHRRIVFYQGRFFNLRRGLRRLGLHRPGRGGAIRLVDRPPDD